MPLSGLKKRLFRIAGPRAYRVLHAGWFYGRMMRALLIPSKAPGFFGEDVTTFAGLLKPGSLVLDIGAFLGGSSALFARAAGPSGRVIAFEPVHHRPLSLAASALRFAPIRVEPMALSSANGVEELIIPIRDGVPLYSQAGFAQSHAAALRPGSGFSFQRQATTLMRLDDYLARESLRPEDVAAVKIDVEGSEMALFAGGEGFFRRFRGPLLCEFWLDAMPPPGWSWLRERGYSCRYLDRQGRWKAVDTPEALAEACRGETYVNLFLERA
jgi:FkbM family methyltransferase